MKKITFIIYFLVISNIPLIAKSINFTGVCYDKVKISKKTIISNPTPILYNKQTNKLVYNQNIPIHMKSAGYWISKTENPDEIILNEKQIKEFNKQIKSKNVGLRKIEEYNDIVNPDNLQKDLERRLFWLKNGKYIDINLAKIPKEFFTDVQETIDLPFINVNFAITTKYCEVRVLPTDIAIYSNPNSLDIDKMQEESIDIGTPVAILCQTKDKEWSYAIMPREAGWIKTENLAFTTKKEITKWNKQKKIAVTTDEKADIFSDKKLKTFIGYVRMGTYFPLKSKNKDMVIIKIPTADENGNLVISNGYMHRNSVNIGFLTYTQRNVFIQAFKHLNSPYGWGGSNCEQDCSGILGQIFNCFGIILPENSAQKIKCGTIFNIDRYEDISIKKAKNNRYCHTCIIFCLLKRAHNALYRT